MSIKDSIHALLVSVESDSTLSMSAITYKGLTKPNQKKHVEIQPQSIGPPYSKCTWMVFTSMDRAISVDIVRGNALGYFKVCVF